MKSWRAYFARAGLTLNEKSVEIKSATIRSLLTGSFVKRTAYKDPDEAKLKTIQRQVGLLFTCCGRVIWQSVNTGWIINLKLKETAEISKVKPGIFKLIQIKPMVLTQYTKIVTFYFMFKEGAVNGTLLLFYSVFRVPRFGLMFLYWFCSVS
jgi:hypothetical protein